jgi:hypothetical protein
MTDANVDLDAACRLLARARDGGRGVWVYRAFDCLNQTYWDGRLPTPLILWLPTPYGKCLADTRACTPGFIRLHPGLLARGADDENGKTPWGYAPQHLGYGLAYEVLLHECIHHAINSGLVSASRKGSTSHNNPAWVSEVNRLAPPLALPITAARSSFKRVPDEGKPPTKRGTVATKPVRTTTGTVPYGAVATFPYGVRAHLGLLDWYEHHQRHTPAGPPPEPGEM